MTDLPPDDPGSPAVDGPDQLSSSVLKRKLVTILSADVAEYSRLMAEDEEQTLRLFREHSETFRVLVDSHHGRIFNTAGDAILAEFTSPVEAVRCATDIQSALRTRNDQFPLSRQVRFRIGVNLGDVMIQNTDLLGDGVNVAARLQSAAPPGGVCISGSVHEQIRNKLSLGFELLGELRFKNIPQTVRTFTISGTNDGGQSPPPKAASKPSGLWLKATVAALSLVILAGGYWAYATRQQSPATLLRTAPAAVGPSATVKPVDTKAAIVPAAANTAVAPAAATQAAPVQSASSDLSSLMRREQAASNKCEDGSGDLDETGRACAERDRLVEVLADKGWCHLTSWQRCAR